MAYEQVFEKIVWNFSWKITIELINITQFWENISIFDKYKISEKSYKFSEKSKERKIFEKHIGRYWLKLFFPFFTK